MGTQTGFGFMLFVVFAASFSGCANSNTGPESVLSKSELVDRTDISISGDFGGYGWCRSLDRDPGLPRGFDGDRLDSPLK
jgi:hypothetical protein